MIYVFKLVLFKNKTKQNTPKQQPSNKTPTQKIETEQLFNMFCINVLISFNDALNTFMVIWHQSYVKEILRKRKSNTPAPTTGAILSVKQQGIFYMHRPTDRIVHFMTLATPFMDHRLEW